MRVSLTAVAKVLAASTALFSGAAFADTAANADAGNAATIVVVGQQQTSAKKVPAVVETVTADQIRTSVNAMTAAETLKYLPSIEVRERYIGDRNGIVATRTTGTVSSAESLVYVDGLLISNLLGNSYNYPPRWGLVTPSEIRQIDMIYGPFSAVYPGNSMGGVINFSTQMPDKFEVHASLTGAREAFHLYGTNEHNLSGDASLALAGRIGNLRIRVDYDHLDAQGHPMSFATDTVIGSADPGSSVAKTVKATAGNPATLVSGAFLDNDQYGVPRYVFGAYSIDHTQQDQGKIKLAYDVTPDVTAFYTAALWGDHSYTGTQSFLTTANGTPFYNGLVTIAGCTNPLGCNYTVSGLEPGITNELQMLNTVALQNRSSSRLSWKLVGSDYDFLTEHTLSATNYGTGTLGTDQDQHGTGWRTGDAQAIWRTGTVADSRHELSFGYHIDAYRLRQATYNLAQWTTYDDGTEASASYGETETNAVYLQDRWRLAQPLTLTLGGRQEWWQAKGGSNFNAAKTPSTVTYPDQSRNYFSPKASLSYDPAGDVNSRLSFGRAVRFPTVTELYQAVTSGNTLLSNDPSLLPEDIYSYDWSTEWHRQGSSIRVSFFQENRKNWIFSQTDATVSPNLTQYENITKARLRGVEGAVVWHNIGPEGLDFQASVTYAQSVIQQDAQNSAYIGNQIPRIPHWRGEAVLTYRPNEKLSYSLAYRHSSASFSTIGNTDVNHDTYGGISVYNVVDAKVSYKLGHGISLSAGVDNASDDHDFVSPHPFPQTTGFLSVKFDR